MKVPREIRTHCPKCNTHTDHTVKLYRAGKRSGNKQGERRQKERKKGYGGQKYPEQHNQAKVTRKQTLLLECSECTHTLMREGMRLKRLEISQ